MPKAALGRVREGRVGGREGRRYGGRVGGGGVPGSSKDESSSRRSSRRACVCSFTAWGLPGSTFDKGLCLLVWRYFMQQASHCSKIGALTLRFGKMAAGLAVAVCWCRCRCLCLCLCLWPVARGRWPERRVPDTASVAMGEPAKRAKRARLPPSPGKPKEISSTLATWCMQLHKGIMLVRLAPLGQTLPSHSPPSCCKPQQAGRAAWACDSRPWTLIVRSGQHRGYTRCTWLTERLTPE